jgi:8-oxo-dGTP pyrophosphatase MutT (NUDIX family)
MAKQRPRPLALGVFRFEDHIFVAEGHDRTRRQTFFRPLGGGIEFGEPAALTVRREIREEIGAEVIVERYLATLENIFTYEGRAGHEIVLLYISRFADPAYYDLGLRCEGTDDGELLFVASWQPLARFATGDTPLYPDGLLDLLAGPLPPPPTA